jgi:hypothetical protein
MCENATAADSVQSEINASTWNRECHVCKELKEAQDTRETELAELEDRYNAAKEEVENRFTAAWEGANKTYRPESVRMPFPGLNVLLFD